MSNNLQVFSNQDFGSVRTIQIDNEPWFVGKDVTKILGYSNSRKAISDHVDNEDKGVTKCDTLGGTQNLVIINESGLYSLIISSKLPNAKKFKHWITSEVLPSIRKTGGYGNNDTLVYKMFEAFTETLKGIQSDINEIKEEKNKALKANKYSRFKTRMFEKMNMLADYFNCTLREIMSNLFIEMENTYDIDIRDYSYECTLKTGVDNPLTLDVVDSNDKLKDCFEAVVDNEMSKAGLEYKNRIRPTIFNSTINEQDSKIVEMPS